MRIAISGSHSLGKSTLVHDWLAANPTFFHEEEPYRALRDWYEIDFRQKSTRLHNGIQLYYNVSRVMRYASATENVIFDRAPVDYIAYSQYTANHGTTDIDNAFIESMVPIVCEALERIDVLVFLPLTDKWQVEMEDDGIRPVDHPYRQEVDTLFKEIYRDGRFQIMNSKNAPRLVELWGPPEERIEKLAQIVVDEQID
ncbi:MAG: hypothetical protein CBB70_12240 [Planctomycetaceae bacterium TMED10]|nr:MAG: hypothetical protein CBB70_12240 [Planctomycetaceae bacterium TMED10]